jgi:hypothetical protein
VRRERLMPRVHLRRWEGGDSPPWQDLWGCGTPGLIGVRGVVGSHHSPHRARVLSSNTRGIDSTPARAHSRSREPARHPGSKAIPRLPAPGLPRPMFK